MICLCADEDLDNHIVRGIRRSLVEVDLVRTQDAGLRGASDPEILAWAASHHRVVLSHDASTMTAAAYSRMSAGEPMPGLIIVPQSLAIGAAIDEIVLIAECSEASEWLDQVRFLPLG